MSDIGKKMLIYMMWGYSATFCRLLEQNGIESLYSTDQTICKYCVSLFLFLFASNWFLEIFIKEKFCCELF